MERWRVVRRFRMAFRPARAACARSAPATRSEEHTSELQHLGISYAVFCLKKKMSRPQGVSTSPGVEIAAKCWQENLLVLLLYTALTVAMNYPAVQFFPAKDMRGP